MKHFYLLIIFIMITSGVFSQIDQEFWFVAPEVSANHGDRPIYIRVATMADPANVTLEMPANPTFTTITQNVPANSVYSFNLTPWIDFIENKPANSVLNYGIHLTSDKKITAYYEETGNNVNPSIYSLKGKNALGTEFFIVSQNRYANQVNDGSEAFDIVATEDGTSLTITATDDIVGGQPVGVPFTVTLNKGQTFTVRATNTTASHTLAGSHITSNKPIAVTWSDDSIITGGWDIVGDQTISINLLGTEYIIIKGFADNIEPNNNDERVFIQATQNNTDVMIDGNATPVANLNIGQFYDYGIPPGSNTALVNTSKPVYVLHLSGHPGEAGGSIMPQDYCTGSRQIGFNRTNSQPFALMILTRSGNEGAFTLNGSTTAIPASDFFPVTGSGGNWMYYRKAMTTTQVPVGQNIISNANGKFHLGILNQLGGSSEYGYFSDFSSLFLGVDHNVCPNVPTTLDAGSGMTTYEWKKFDYSAGNWNVIGSAQYLTLPDSGLYACMTNGDFCTLRDTIHIGYFPFTAVNLGPDKTGCTGQSILLDAGAGYTQYLWSTGATTQTISVTATNTYSVTVKDANNCTSTDGVVVTFYPQPFASVTGTSTVCQNDSPPVITFTGSSGTEPYTFYYTLNGGATQSITTSGSNIATITQSTATPGSYTYALLSVTDGNGCSQAQPGTAVITVNPLPAAAIAGNAAVCSGAPDQVITFTGSSGIAPFTFYYKVNGGATQSITTTTGNTVTILQSTATPGNFAYTLESVTDANFCSQAQAGTATVTVYSLPAASISGTVAVCSGAAAPLITFSGASGNSPYTFYYKLNGGPTQSVTTTGGSTVTVSQPTGTPGTFVYSLESVTDGNLCTQAQSGSATVTVNPLPAAAITGSVSLCSGAPSPVITFTGSNGTAPYTFYYKVNAGPALSLTTTAGNSATVTQSTAIAGTFVYTLESVTDANGCSQVQLGSATITVFSLPAAAISGTTTVCQNATPPVITFTGSNGSTPYTFYYKMNGGATQNITTTTGNMATVSQATTIPGTFIYTLESVSDFNGCSQTQSGTATVTVNPTPVLAVTGTNDLCAGSAGITYSTTPGMTSYGWTISAGGTPVGSTTSSSVIVNWAANAPASQSVSVAYTNSLGCSGLTLYPVTIRPLPVSTFTGTTTVCQLNPSPYLYTADAGPACSYTWSINPASAGTIANAAVSPASITWNTPGGATLALSAVTTFGCSTSSSQPIVINPRPDVSITPCFDVVTNRSAKQFLLKGGRPLLTTTPLQGEYIITPVTPALTSDVAGNFWFNPAMVPGTNTVTFSLSYKYTSSQFGCPATSPTSVTLTVRAANPPCGASMTDYRDNTTYRTSFVAGRCWMMENLRYGTLLAPITTAQTDNCTTEKYCLASDATCTTYGGLYQWDELIQYGITAGPEYQGVCPAGWHIPTAADYQALIDANQGNGIAGSFLTDPNLTPRGFEALARGMAYLNTAWAFTVTDIPSGTLFWTSTPGSGNRFVTRGMNSKVQSVQYYEAIKADAFPVRCVKD